MNDDQPQNTSDPFVEVWPRTPDRDQALRALVLPSPFWRLALGSLYLLTGRFIPQEAKRRGCAFGFCNAAGVLRPMRDPEATHLGWTLDTEANERPMIVKGRRCVKHRVAEREILERVAKYAAEDGAVTPGSTRLARALAELAALRAPVEVRPGWRRILYKSVVRADNHGGDEGE